MNITDSRVSHQIEAFRRDGYLIQRGVLTEGQLERYRQLARRIQAQTREHLYPGTRYWYEGSGNKVRIPEELRPMTTWGVNEITRKELFDPELIDVFAQPGIHATIHMLLGREPRAWGLKVLWTPKVTGYNLSWHRDQVDRSLYDYVQYKPAEQDHVQFNVALNDDDCFLVVPGSHRRVLSDAEWYALSHDGTAKLPGQIVAELQPGDMLFMDAHTLHRGRSDIDGDRLTLHYSAQAQWVPLAPWGDPEHFAWITCEEFIGQLAPETRPYYERLRTAERSNSAMEFIVNSARKHGWSPSKSQ